MLRDSAEKRVTAMEIQAGRTDEKMTQLIRDMCALQKEVAGLRSTFIIGVAGLIGVQLALKYLI